MKPSGRLRKALLILLGVLLAVVVLVLDFSSPASSRAIPETGHVFTLPVYRVIDFITQTIHP